MKNKDQTINKLTGGQRQNSCAEDITFGHNSLPFCSMSPYTFRTQVSSDPSIAIHREKYLCGHPSFYVFIKTPYKNFNIFRVACLSP
jgi:hypothetical protein